MSPPISWLPALAAGIGFGPLVLGGCGARDRPAERSDWEIRRADMVADQIVARGVRDARVLAAMRTVERHLFVPEHAAPLAYEDQPLSIGYEQTISQPFVVAFMSEAAEVRPDDRVLEIGTGSGYQAAVLAHLAREVYSIEIVEPLATSAAERLARLGYDAVRVRHGDGYAGWPAAAPFDVILLTAAPREIPQPLIDQLGPGGRLIAPVGGRDQDLVRLRRTATGIEREELLFVRFVPMTGEAQRKSRAGGLR
jgi:protein-L-isoaspartate(D-aspartate) O-methyltransferase